MVLNVKLVILCSFLLVTQRSQAAVRQQKIIEKITEDTSAEADSSTEITVVSVATSSSAELHEGSGDDPPDPSPPINKNLNETREALKTDGSEQDPVVFLSDKNSYIPVSIKPRSPTAAEAAWGREPPAWEREYRRHRTNGSRVQYIEAECQDDFMKIRVGFNGSFSGLVYSAGYSYDPDCMYINGSGRDYYEFYIQLNRCGTLGRNSEHADNRKHPTKNLMWNTITVQYNPLIEEELDEHFKVTCEYGYDFWKTVTFPFLDVEVATGNPVVFTLQPPECYMEIRSGYGATGARVSGPVRVGDPLTLLIYMRSAYDGFDIVVNDCFAHNGATKRIQLIDEYGCPVDDKLISRFRGSWSESGVFETQVFAYMKTFRFTGSPALYIECDVRMCHGRCPSDARICHWKCLISHNYFTFPWLMIIIEVWSLQDIGSWSESGVFETQVFAYMKTFRFTGSPALYIECDVRMCHGRCPVSYNYYMFPWLKVRVKSVRDASVRIYEDLQVHRLTRALHRVRRQDVPREMPSKSQLLHVSLA
ncbi:zona pellucida-like domain-containing protein [Phthorimaea operculella]|nr:zona pellucida-like domain-containing protein [Phthorimaea operculella]